MSKSLSKDLAHWRAERPDEWTMDEFMRKAKFLETALIELTDTNSNWRMNVAECREKEIEGLIRGIQST